MPGDALRDDPDLEIPTLDVMPVDLAEPDLADVGAIGSSELREAVADGPILFRGLENVHEHVLRADAGAFAEQLRDPPEQRFLLFQGCEC